MGEGLARFHTLSCNNPKLPQYNTKLSIRKLLEIYQNYPGIITFIENCMEILPSFTDHDNYPEFGLVHGSYDISQLKFDGENVYSDDFHSSHLNWRIIDLCIAEILILISEHKDGDLVDAFYGGYENIRKLSTWEKSVRQQALELGKLVILSNPTTEVKKR